MNGYRACTGCREMEPTSTWRTEHHKVLCAACNIDHGRVAEYEGAAVLSAPLFRLSPRALAVMEGVS